MAEHQQHNLTDMDGDSRSSLFLNLVAQTLEALRRHLSRLQLRQLSRNGAIINGSAHRQGAVRQSLSSRLGIGFVLEMRIRPSAKRQRLS